MSIVAAHDEERHEIWGEEEVRHDDGKGNTERWNRKMKEAWSRNKEEEFKRIIQTAGEDHWCFVTVGIYYSVREMMAEVLGFSCGG